jgi:Mor family transcriptional regulator
MSGSAAKKVDEGFSLMFVITEAIMDTRVAANEEEACEIAQVIMERICERRGGERMYCPTTFLAAHKGHLQETVRAEFNGRNVRELMAKYNISRTTVYRWVQSKK